MSQARPSAGHQRAAPTRIGRRAPAATVRANTAPSSATRRVPARSRARQHRRQPAISCGLAGPLVVRSSGLVPAPPALRAAPALQSPDRRPIGASQPPVSASDSCHSAADSTPGLLPKSSLAQTTFVPSRKAESQLPLGGTRACLHSPCPEDSGDEVDEGGEAFVGLLIARGNASKGFYAAEEVFDEMPPLVFFSVMLRISAGSLAERNDGLHVVGAQSFAQPAGIKSLVADQGQATDAGHESVEAVDVVPLARQKHEADQIAERIYDDRDLRRQAAARFADGLILSPPFAPVPC